MMKHQPQTTTTPANVVKNVYDSAYPLASAQAYPQALPDILYVGNGSCEHSVNYIVQDVCLICFLSDGFQNELPGQMHRHKTLTVNGNPDQTAQLMSHVQVVEGFRPPKSDESLRDFRRARKQYTSPAHGRFPFSSALWELMGFQPPLAIPLILLISGLKAPKIAEKLDISIYNLHERLQKGVKLTVSFLRI